MIKYVIRKDSQVEFRSLPSVEINNSKDLQDFADIRTATYYDEIASYNDLEKAKNRFLVEKDICTTITSKSNGFIVILFDDLKLLKEEYNDDGEFLCELEQLDRYTEGT